LLGIIRYLDRASQSSNKHYGNALSLARAFKFWGEINKQRFDVIRLPAWVFSNETMILYSLKYAEIGALSSSEN